MIRLLHTADWHIDVKRRFDAHVAALEGMIVEGIQEHVDAFVFAGDFAGLDAPHHLRTKEILALLDLFSLAAAAAPLIVIPGNHDEFEQFKIFEKLNLGKNFHLSLKPERYSVETASGTLHVHALPWLGRKSIYELSGIGLNEINNVEASSLLSQLAQSRRAPEHSILVTHFAVPSALMGQIEVSTQHDVALDISEINEQYAYIALGHLHRRQSIRCGTQRRRAYYSGSPAPIDFSEVTKRGANIVHLTNDAPRVTLQKVKSWRMLTVDVGEVGVNFSKQLLDDYSDTYVRANVTIPKEGRLIKRLKHFKQVEQAFIDRGALGVKINKLPPATPEQKPMPKFLNKKLLDDQLDQVMEDKHYDRDTRGRIHRALGSIRERRSQLASGSASDE